MVFFTAGAPPLTRRVKVTGGTPGQGPDAPTFPVAEGVGPGDLPVARTGDRVPRASCRNEDLLGDHHRRVSVPVFCRDSPVGSLEENRNQLIFSSLE